MIIFEDSEIGEIFDEMMAKNFPKLMRDINSQTQRLCEIQANENEKHYHTVLI